MISRTNSTSVNGVMLISAMTSWSCCDESSAHGRASRAATCAGFRRLVELGRDRRAGVVEVQHLGELIGRDDHLLVVVLDARLEEVEEHDRDDGDDQTGRGGDQRFGNARRDDGRRRVALQRDVLEGPDDAEDRSEETDERRDDGDGADDRQVTLERVQVLHQRDRERVGDVGAILLAAAETELEDPRKHAAVASCRFRSLRSGRRPRPSVPIWRSRPFVSECCDLEEDEALDDDGEADDRDQQEQPHIPAALLHEIHKSRKHRSYHPPLDVVMRRPPPREGVPLAYPILKSW